MAELHQGELYIKRILANRPGFFLLYIIKNLCHHAAWDDAVCNEVCYYCCYSEAYEDEGCKCLSDDLESLLPNLVAPSDGLECAPESVSEVEPESCEPSDVDDHHPYASECLLKEEV